MTPDFTNGLFEFLGGAMLLNHCRVLYKHKHTAGVSKFSVLFFLLWGCWNMFYYPHLGQYWSFSGGLFVVLTNLLYIVMLLYYSKANEF